METEPHPDAVHDAARPLYAAGAELIRAGGEMARRIREYDWSATPLGSLPSWPQSLKTALHIMLASRHPMCIWWGPQLILLYNDAYMPILASRHPDALGQPASEVWRAIWDILGPPAQALLCGAPATWTGEQLLSVARHGDPEEACCTFSHSPIPDGGGTGGVICIAEAVSPRRESIPEDVPEHVAASSQDLAERETIGEQLAYQASLIAIVHDAVIGFDRAERIRYWSPGAERLYGWKAEEAIGRTWDELLEPLQARDGADRPDRGIRFTEGGTLQGEHLTRRRNGEPFWVEFTAHGYFEPSGKLSGYVTVHRDITERKHAEQALRESEERMRLATQAAKVFSWDVDLPAGSVRYSGSVAPLFGYATLPDEAHDIRRATELVHPEDRARVRRTMKHALEEKGSIAVEYRFRTAQGRYVWVETHGIVIRNGYGAAKRLIGISRDIEARKERDQEIAALQKRLAEDLAGMTRLQEISARLIRAGAAAELLQDIVDAAIAVTGADMGNIRLPDTASRQLRIVAHRGFGDEYLKELSEIRDMVSASLTAMQTRERVIIEDVEASPLLRGLPQRQVMLAAGIRAVQSTPLLNRSGGLVGVLSTHYRTPRRPAERDLHLLDLLARQAADWIERMQAQEALRESEARFRTLADSSPHLMWVVGPDARVQFVNRAFLDFFGVTQADLDSSGWRRLLHPEDAAGFNAEITAALREGRPFAMAARVRRKDGAWRWLQSNGASRTSPEGGAVASSLDVTEQYEAQRLLKEADRRKDEFLATLAHELRNPLAPVRQAAGIASSPHATPAQVRWSHEVIERQVKHMALLLDDLLEVTRISQGRLELKKEPIDLTTVLDTALESVRPLIEARRHTLKLELSHQALRLEADSLRLAQVFSNLLANAAKYTDVGGDISVSAQHDGQSVVVTFSDSGIGIPEESLPTIFEMYTQLPTASERAEGGLGIGLALCKGLVELHGGTISAQSAGLGKGSSFTVRLPAMRAERSYEAARSAAADGPPDMQPRKVLVVDDDPDAAETLATFIALQGHEVKTANNGHDALDMAALFEPDVMLLDIGMPRLNGYELAQRVRGEHWGRKATLIALTGWGQREDRERAIEAGFDYHLTKPVDPAIVESLLHGAPLR